MRLDAPQIQESELKMNSDSKFAPWRGTGAAPPPGFDGKDPPQAESGGKKGTKV